MSEGSSSSSSGWMWIIVAVLIVAVGWVGSAVYYEYRQAQQIEDAEAAAQTATDEAIADQDARQLERESALSQRIDELEDEVGRLDEPVEEPTAGDEAGTESP